MADIGALLGEHGVLIVFANVLLTQLGVPLPAVPTMVVAGALAAGGHLSGPHAFAVAWIASLVADSVWYAAGERFGHRVLTALCRVSLSPSSCVRQTERVFVRYGVGSLVIAKFVPGLATVAPPLAGAMRMPFGRFFVFDGIGSILWVGAAMVGGWLVSSQIDAALAWIARMGGYAGMLLGLLLVVYMAFKWLERYRFLAQLRTARIAVGELYAMMERGEDPLILDVRSAAALGSEGTRIPRALLIDPDSPDVALEGLPRDREIVVYCS